MPNLVSLTQTQSADIRQNSDRAYFGFPNFLPKNADISKIKGVIVLKGKFSETSELRVHTYKIPNF